MATVTGLTAARMEAIEGQSVVDAEIVGGNLILTRFNGTTINAGPVVGPQGPAGPAGPAGFGAIPGEVRLWPGGALPPEGSYGKWVWADGAVYAVATYPLAASYIATQWRTFSGASDPGVNNFRVPDLRGLTPVGLDAMPGGTRANRTTRAVAITLAGRTGTETHVVQVSEMPSHSHGVTDNGHAHSISPSGDTYHQHGEVVKFGVDIELAGGQGGLTFDDNYGNTDNQYAGTLPGSTDPAGTGIGIQANGGGAGHENMQPTVFVPYIVCLHG